MAEVAREVAERMAAASGSVDVVDLTDEHRAALASAHRHAAADLALTLAGLGADPDAVTVHEFAVRRRARNAMIEADGRLRRGASYVVPGGVVLVALDGHGGVLAVGHKVRGRRRT